MTHKFEPLMAGAFFAADAKPNPDLPLGRDCLPLPVVLTVNGKLDGKRCQSTVNLMVEDTPAFTVTCRKLEQAMTALRGWLALNLNQPRGLA